MKFGGKPRSFRQFLTKLFAVALALNWLWEMLQMPAFDQMVDRSWRSTALTCIFASLGDAAITLGIYAVVALTMKCWQWAAKGKWTHYLTAGLSGAAVAVVIEKAALAAGLWIYSRRMPVVPMFGVGLLPLLQLMLLVPVAIRIAAWWHRPIQPRRWLQAYRCGNPNRCVVAPAKGVTYDQSTD